MINFPEPRTGLAGFWDRLIGPGATFSENTLIIVSSVVGGIGAAAPFALAGLPSVKIIVAALLGFNVIGGAVANATNTTKAWYHRPGVGFIQQLGFLLPHLIHIFLVAWLFRAQPFDISYMLIISSALLLSGLIVILSPKFLKRPVAAGLYLVAIAIALYVTGLTLSLEWFVPALFLKLLIGHLVPEAVPVRDAL